MSWSPIPKKFHNGILLSYKISYQAIKVGDVEVEKSPFYATADMLRAYEIVVPPNTTSWELTQLPSYTLYRIDVMGVTVKGPGPNARALAGET